jgi:hypothetical protein
MTLAVTPAHIARRDHDRELKMEQTVLGLPIKASNSNAIPNPLVGTANEAASDMVRYAAELSMARSARFRLSVDRGSAASSKRAGLIDLLDWTDATANRWPHPRRRPSSSPAGLSPGYVASAQFAKLADHPQIGRHRLIREVLPPLGMGDLRDVDIAVRVDGQTMRAHVAAWRDTRKQTANTFNPCLPKFNRFSVPYATSTPGHIGSTGFLRFRVAPQSDAGPFESLIQDEIRKD